MSNADYLLDYAKFGLRFDLLSWLRSKDFFGLAFSLDKLLISAFAYYFYVNLNMTEKIFSFIISGKLVGTAYEINFTEFTKACLGGAVIVAAFLLKSIYHYFRYERRMKNKLQLRFSETSPSKLFVRLA